MRNKEKRLDALVSTQVIDSNFDSYRDFAGDIEARDKGSLLAFEDGEATSHGLLGAQDRGQLFATPKTAVCPRRRAQRRNRVDAAAPRRGASVFYLLGRCGTGGSPPTSFPRRQGHGRRRAPAAGGPPRGPVQNRSIVDAAATDDLNRPAP